MLTQQQYNLLQFINQRIKEEGVSPSFDEMRVALGLKSKSGIHKLIQSLEERGYIRRLPNRARALEVSKLPQQNADDDKITNPTRPKEWNIPQWATPHLGDLLAHKKPAVRLSEDLDDGASTRLPLYGKIAAGTPITALQDNSNFVDVPAYLVGSGAHYCLRVEGDSMVEAGILDNDIIIVKKTDMVDEGTIAVALIDEEEATLKRVYSAGSTIVLKPANRHYREREFSRERVRIQGKLVGLLRRFF